MGLLNVLSQFHACNWNEHDLREEVRRLDASPSGSHPSARG